MGANVNIGCCCPPPQLYGCCFYGGDIHAESCQQMTENDCIIAGGIHTYDCSFGPLNYVCPDRGTCNVCFDGLSNGRLPLSAYTRFPSIGFCLKPGSNQFWTQMFNDLLLLETQINSDQVIFLLPGIQSCQLNRTIILSRPSNGDPVTCNYTAGWAEGVFDGSPIEKRFYMRKTVGFSTTGIECIGYSVAQAYNVQCVDVPPVNLDCIQRSGKSLWCGQCADIPWPPGYSIRGFYGGGGFEFTA